MLTNNLNRVLRKHLGTACRAAPTITEQFGAMEHPNLQLAIEGYIAADGRSASLIGVHSPHPHFGPDAMSALASYRSAGWRGQKLRVAPPAYRQVSLGEQESITCVQDGIYLIQDGRERIAIGMCGPGSRMEPDTRISVLTGDMERSRQLLGAIRTQMRQRNVYRGRVLQVTAGECGAGVAIRSLPGIARENLILPAELLGRIERHTLGFVACREALSKAGRHLKRGILFHGPPGTGKTLTALYLAGKMKDRTVLLVAGDSLPSLGDVCGLARHVQPSLIVLEDIDLIAEDRRTSVAGTNRLLYELLNEMDGMSEDSDVMFLLTTNRPEVLEPALAARPGRVDNAFEIPLPDADCRRRLFELYAGGMQISIDDWDAVIRRTEGVTASFIRELLRTAALYAVNGSEEFTVGDRHIDEALRDMALTGGTLKRSILGAGKMGFASESDGGLQKTLQNGTA